MRTDLPTWMTASLSDARLGKYLAATSGDAERTVVLYQWNLQVCQAFYAPLHWLEVGLRNALHARLSERYGSEHWWDRAPLNGKGKAKVRGLRQELGNRGTGSGADDLVAKLSFGFWDSLLHKGLTDRNAWTHTLHKAFPHYSGTVKPLRESVERTRIFRNRVMHYEPIFHWDLAARREMIHQLLGYLSPKLAEHVDAADRVPQLLTDHPAHSSAREAGAVSP